jgi:CRISPR/Cas system-associated protein Csm6
MTPAGGLSPEVNMMVIAGIMLLFGACAVFIIKEKEE